MEDHNMGVVNLPKTPNKLKSMVRLAWQKLRSKPIYLYATIIAIIGVGATVYTFAASNQYSGKINQKNPVATHGVTVESSGELIATLRDSGRRNSDNVRFVLTLKQDNKDVVSYSATKAGEQVVLTAQVSPASYELVVSTVDKLTNRGATYSLDLTYPDPTPDPEPVPDTSPPTVTINQPVQESSVSGDMTLSGTAIDDTRVEVVLYRFVGGSWQTALGTNSWTGLLDTTMQANGSIIVEVQAKDAAGNSKTAQVTVTIQNFNNDSGGGGVTPPTGPVSGVWISRDELMSLPMSGDGWQQIEDIASGPLPAPDFSDNTNKHDTATLALAYHAVRTSNADELSQVVQEIERGIAGGSTSSLDFCRNINSYIIAADVINLSEVNSGFDTTFRKFLNDWMFSTNTGLRGHTGDGVRGTASESANNWGTMCRGSYASAAVYTGNEIELDNITKWHKGWLGDRATYAGFGFREDQTWHADQNNKKGVNSKGATIQGYNVDGVLPEDQRRTGGFEWPAPKGSYPWEAMQGALVADVVLQRAGKISADFEDSAMLRVYNWLYNVNNNPATGDDEWQMWVVNKVYGTNYPTATSVSQGKIMGWTDWTHR